MGATDPAAAPGLGELTTELWDAIVIGTGMGGATVGFELARRGRRVLFLEKGRFLHRDPEAEQGELGEPSEDPEDRLRRGWWPHPIAGRTDVAGGRGGGWLPVRGFLDDGEVDFFAPLGCGTGGSSVLYGATLERFHPSDFRPRANFPEAPDSSLPEAWPIEWQALEPFYAEAERLYDVHGTPDPLLPEDARGLPAPPPLNAQDQSVHDLLVRKGFHPYRSHVGLAFAEGCAGCGGRLCLKRCKGDAGRVCLLPALDEHGARLIAECEVERLESDGRSVTAVHARKAGQAIRLRGRTIVLAAGALMSPALLLASKSEAWPDGLANGSGYVGRNLMVHAGDMIAVRPSGRAEGGGFNKSLSINDLYFCEGRKLGNFQSLGVPVDTGSVLAHLRTTLDKGPDWLQRLVPGKLLRLMALVGSYLFRNAVVFSSILEDLPYLHNRVWPDPSTPSGIRFEYTYPEELGERNALFRRALLRRLGRRHATVLSRPVNLNFGHSCGTIRFGDDPATSVLDASNRAHEVENLYVVDASFFPSSGGVNPSLTIAANALRVAGILDERLAAEPARGSSIAGEEPG